MPKLLTETLRTQEALEEWYLAQVTTLPNLRRTVWARMQTDAEFRQAVLDDYIHSQPAPALAEFSEGFAPEKPSLRLDVPGLDIPDDAFAMGDTEVGRG